MIAPVETGKVSVSLQRLRYLERDSEECGELKRQLSEVKRERDFLRSRFTRKIVCLCGSTRFYRTFRDFNKRLTLQGIIVLSIGCEHHSDDELGITDEQKIELDELHKCKIDLADEVLVLDVNGYIGSSTKSEIEYAKSRGKSIRYLSKEFPGYREPVDPMEGLCEIDLDNLRVLDKRNGKVYTHVSISSLEWHNSHVTVHVYDPEEEYPLFGMEWPVDCIILIDDNSRMHSCDWCDLCDGEDIDKA